MSADAIESIPAFVSLGEILATGGQPSEAQLEGVANAGFTVVINLALHDDPSYSLHDEAATVAALGMQYVHIPVQFSSPRLSQLTAFSAAMERAGASKVFVHCRHNKRVPVFIALHRILELGWSRDAALSAMREVWQPDETWQEFIAQALAQGESQPDLPPLPLTPAGRYRHYKGGEYEVLGAARHSETREALVVYRPLYDASGLWVRPHAMFFGQVEVDGKRQPRFAFIAWP